MASYSYTFTGSNGAAWETGWHTVAGTVDIQSNKGRTLTAGSAYASAGAYFDGVTIDQDTDIYVDAVIQTVTSTEFYAAVNVRAGSTSFTDVKQHSSWHCLFVGATAQGYTVLYRISSAGAATFLVGGADKDFVQGDTLHMRFSPTGTQFRCKYWRNSDPEPSSWDIDYTDASAPTGSMMSLMIRNGNNAVADDWRWDSLVVGGGAVNASAGLASATGAANAASGNTVKAVSAPVAIGAGSALFEPSGGSSSVTIESVDAVDANGTAHNATIGIGKSPTPATATGAGAAHAPTGQQTTANAAALVAAGSGAANAPAPSDGVAPAPGVGAGAANAATITTITGTVTAAAQVALGEGAATGGVSYILDENGDPVLDENGDPIDDGYSLGLTVALTSGLSTSAGTSHAPSRTVAPQGVGAATAAGSALAPSISTGGSTNVNAQPASGTGTANPATDRVSPAASATTSTGSAAAPQTSLIVNTSTAAGVGAAYDRQGLIPAQTALSVGAALNAQVDVAAQNFVGVAAIPIAATAPNAQISLWVNAGDLSKTGIAYPPNQQLEPGQVVTLRDSGHTVSVKER